MSFRMPCLIVVAALLAGTCPCARAAAPEPTFADVAYGPYDSNKLDFWKAPSDKPTPVIVEIHGGGFYEGDKRGFRHSGPDIKRSLDMGVSLASINYRFINDAALRDILRDSARAIQFLRYNAAEWNIDKTRIASFGESAGAGTSLWLAFHDDLADPNNADPVLRESTRLIAAGAIAPQASYDFTTWPGVLHIPQFIWSAAKWSICPKYYHLNAFGIYMPKAAAMRADLDMMSLIDPNDPPVYLLSTQVPAPMDFANGLRFVCQYALQSLRNNTLASPEKVMRDASLNFDILHHPLHAQAIEKICGRIGVPCIAIYRDTPEDQRISKFDFVLKRVMP